MPTVPKLRDRVTTAPLPGDRVSPQDALGEGAGNAQALVGLAGSVSRAAGVAHEQMIGELEREQTLIARRTIFDAEKSLHALVTDFRTKDRQDAVDAYPKFLDASQKLIEEGGKGLETEFTRQLYAANMLSAEAQAVNQMGTHRAGQVKVVELDLLAAESSNKLNASTLAVVDGDLPLAQANMDLAVASQLERARQQGIASKVELDNVEIAVRTKGFRANVDALADMDANLAVVYINSPASEGIQAGVKEEELKRLEPIAEEDKAARMALELRQAGLNKVQMTEALDGLEADDASLGRKVRSIVNKQERDLKAAKTEVYQEDLQDEIDRAVQATEDETPGQPPYRIPTWVRGKDRTTIRKVRAGEFDNEAGAAVLNEIENMLGDPAQWAELAGKDMSKIFNELGPFYQRGLAAKAKAQGFLRTQETKTTTKNSAHIERVATIMTKDIDTAEDKIKYRTEFFNTLAEYDAKELTTDLISRIGFGLMREYPIKDGGFFSGTTPLYEVQFAGKQPIIRTPPDHWGVPEELLNERRTGLELKVRDPETGDKEIITDGWYDESSESIYSGQTGKRWYNIKPNMVGPINRPPTEFERRLRTFGTTGR